METSRRTAPQAVTHAVTRNPGGNPEALTEARFRRLLPRAARYEVADPATPGLRVRVLPDGRKIWSLMYRLPSTHEVTRTTLGVFPTVAKASAAAEKLRARVVLGEDPNGQKRAARAAKAAEKKAGTVADLFAEFDRAWLAHVRPVTADGWRRVASRLILPRIGRRQPRSLSQADVREFRGNRTAWEALRLALNWAVAEGRVDANPCLALPRRFDPARRCAGTRRARSAKRLGLGQLRAALPLMPPHVSLVGVTAVREHEARSARWADFDLEGALWVVPGAFTKTGDEHRVPLVPAALAVVERARAANAAAGLAASPWLFPGSGTCEVCRLAGHAPKTSSKTSARAKVAAGIIDRGVIHRIRDTAKSWMSDAGVPASVSERVLGHALAGMERVYDHAEMIHQQRAALERWSAALLASPPALPEAR